MVETKVIAKNTGFLYMRMVLNMLIGLFSVRIVLQTLGENDFGIYNVVGSVVTMLAFLNNSLSSTVQRFLSFEIGRGDKKALHSVFCNSMVLYIWICLAFLLFAQTVGLWIVNYKLIIPMERITAANWVYQFSIFSFIFTIISSPYNALIIAKEKMKIYAYISIVESILKLALIFSLMILQADKLILYGLFLMIVSVAVFLFNWLYCHKHFEEAAFRYEHQSEVIKEIGGFAGWSLWGSLSNIFKGQGVNILLNILFGPVVNAARGIAYQVEGAVNTLVQNFYLAIKPQLIKTYAENDNKNVYRLLFISTRMGYYLMYIVSLVFILEAQVILSFWLGQVPQHTIEFMRLVLIAQLFIVLANPLMTAIHATGKVAKYQFWSGWVFIMVLPVSYFLLRLYPNPLIPFIVIIFSSAFYWGVTIERCYRQIRLPLKEYFTLIMRLFMISMLLLLGAIFIYLKFDEGWIRLLIQLLYAVVAGGTAILYIDCSLRERLVLKELLKKRMQRSPHVVTSSTI